MILLVGGITVATLVSSDSHTPPLRRIDSLAMSLCSIRGDVAFEPGVSVSASRAQTVRILATLHCDRGGERAPNGLVGKLDIVGHDESLSCSSQTLPSMRGDISWEAHEIRYSPTSVAWSGGTMEARAPAFATGTPASLLEFGASKSRPTSGSLAHQQVSLHIVMDGLSCSSGRWSLSRFSNAIDASYLAFRQLTTAAQPTAPYRGAFYYPWFPRNWTQLGITPFTHYVPTGGYYSSADPAVIERQLNDMEYAGIRVGISSWWGPGSEEDRRFQELLDVTDAGPMKWAVMDECERFPSGCNGPGADERITTDLAYITRQYVSDPNYWKIGGHPVIVVYNNNHADSCDTVERWSTIAHADGYFVVMRTISGYASCASPPDSWRVQAVSATMAAS